MAINRTAVTLAVSVTAVVAVGIGGGIAAIANSSGSGPSRQVSTTQAATTAAPVTVHASASPARPSAAVAVKVSPSKHQVVKHRKARNAIVTNQEPAVTDPTSTAVDAPVDPTPTAPRPGNGIVVGPGRSGGSVPGDSAQEQAGS